MEATTCGGGTQCGHGPGCEEWVTVHVLDLAAESWFTMCGDSEPVEIRHMVQQELRGITCTSKSSTSGWYEELRPPYRKRTILATHVE